MQPAGGGRQKARAGGCGLVSNGCTAWGCLLGAPHTVYQSPCAGAANAWADELPDTAHGELQNQPDAHTPLPAAT